MRHTHFFCFLYTIRRPFDLRRRSRSPGFVLCALHFSGNKKANPEDGRRFTRTTLSAPASGPSCDRSSTQLHRGLLWLTPPISLWIGFFRLCSYWSCFGAQGRDPWREFFSVISAVPAGTSGKISRRRIPCVFELLLGRMQPPVSSVSAVW